MYIYIGTLTAIFKLLFPIIYSFESTILMMVYAHVPKLNEHFDVKSEFKYPSYVVVVSLAIVDNVNLYK